MLLPLDMGPLVRPLKRLVRGSPLSISGNKPTLTGQNHNHHSSKGIRGRCIRRVFLSRIQNRSRSGACARSCERWMLTLIELLNSFTVAATQLSASLLILADSSQTRTREPFENRIGLPSGEVEANVELV
ncbi:hypothetical protein AB1N83_012877 [Pleurotus pulmonarius]